MNEYVESQKLLQKERKKAFLFLVLGSLGAYVFIPIAVLALYGLYLYWRATWKIHTAKCPNCNKNIGLVQHVSNEKCRNCGYIFIKPVTNRDSNWPT